MLKFGLEGEFFLQNSKEEFILVPSEMPKDGCGYLVEARGEAHTNPYAAVALYQVEVQRLEHLCRAKNLSMLTATPQKLPSQLRRDALRANGKRPQDDRALYGKWNNPQYQHAGLHVHFSAETSHVCSAKGCFERHTHPQQLDIGAIVVALDKAFKPEILAAKRALGLYKLKPYGFEYRSLPASIPTARVAEVLAAKPWGEL